MNASQPVITITIIAILIVAVLVFIIGKDRNQNRIRPLVGLAFSCIVAGILYGENRYLGYAMMAAGVIVAVIDIFYSVQGQIDRYLP